MIIVIEKDIRALQVAPSPHHGGLNEKETQGKPTKPLLSRSDSFYYFHLKCLVHCDFLSYFGSQFIVDGLFFTELNEVLMWELTEDGYSDVEVHIHQCGQRSSSVNVLGRDLQPCFLWSISHAWIQFVLLSLMARGGGATGNWLLWSISGSTSQRKVWSSTLRRLTTGAYVSSPRLSPSDTSSSEASPFGGNLHGSCYLVTGLSKRVQ